MQRRDQVQTGESGARTHAVLFTQLVLEQTLPFSLSHLRAAFTFLISGAYAFCFVTVR